MKASSRNTLRTVARFLILHVILMGIFAAVSTAVTSREAGDLFLLWAGLIITSPMLVISALVGIIVAIILNRATGRLVPPAPAFTSSFDDRSPDTGGISMTGQSMNDGHDSHGRSFGMHDD